MSPPATPSQRAEQERRAAVISKAAARHQTTATRARDVRGRTAQAVDRQLLAPAGTRSRRDRHPTYRQGRLRSLWRRPAFSRRSAARRRCGIAASARTPAPTSPTSCRPIPRRPSASPRAIAVARQIGAPGIGDAGRDGYLAAIDGMMFGDDPAEGVDPRPHVHAARSSASPSRRRTASCWRTPRRPCSASRTAARGAAARQRRTSRPARRSKPIWRSGWIDGLHRKQRRKPRWSTACRP